MILSAITIAAKMYDQEIADEYTLQKAGFLGSET